MPNARFNVNSGQVDPNAIILSVPVVNIPHYHEVFLLTQSISGFYEFRPFADFYRTLVIEMNTQTPFALNHNSSYDNQQYSINCATCNSANSADWTPYYTSCTIRNKQSNLCMSAVGDNKNLGQVNCDSATKWDLLGRTSTDIANPNCPPTTKLPPDNIQISKGGLAATVLGSIIGTSLIALGLGYWFVQRKRIYPGHALNI